MCTLRARVWECARDQVASKRGGSERAKGGSKRDGRNGQEGEGEGGGSGGGGRREGDVHAWEEEKGIERDLPGV